jgi:4'-phosphopantetheinyl transferase
MAILAITKKHPIGVDLECIKPIEDITDIARQFFSPQEHSKFILVPEDQKIETFYTIWTRKEAFIKAIGEGLSYPLNTFDVAFLSNDPVKILQINNSTIDTAKWSLHSLTFNYLNNLYIIAIITNSPPKNMIYFNYSIDIE